MTDAPRPPTPSIGPLGRTWAMIVAAAKVGGAMFWGVPPTRVVLPAEAAAPDSEAAKPAAPDGGADARQV